MHDTKNHRLEELIVTLEDHLALVRSYGLMHSALFLAAAKLDLQMHIHGISDEELRELCEALDRQCARAKSRSNKAAQVGVCNEQGNVVPISQGRRHRRASCQTPHPLARGPIRTA
jgi:hypothetical protein